LTRPAFKTDENLPREVASLLKDHGYDALTVHDQALVGRPDEDIASVCKTENRALITLDRDFSNILAYPPADHPGIVVLRSDHHDKATVLALMSRVVVTLAKEPLAGKLWIVESDRVRIWRSWDE
jgi:predicted nuclease of predicted toxin-antitoxin system